MRACELDPADERGRDRARSAYLCGTGRYAPGSDDGIRGCRVSSRRNGEVRRERAEVGPPTLSMASDDGLSRACVIRSADRPFPLPPEHRVLRFRRGRDRKGSGTERSRRHRCTPSATGAPARVADIASARGHRKSAARGRNFRRAGEAPAVPPRRRDSPNVALRSSIGGCKHAHPALS